MESLSGLNNRSIIICAVIGQRSRTPLSVLRAGVSQTGWRRARQSLISKGIQALHAMNQDRVSLIADSGANQMGRQTGSIGYI